MKKALALSLTLLLLGCSQQQTYNPERALANHMAWVKQYYQQQYPDTWQQRYADYAPMITLPEIPRPPVRPILPPEDFDPPPPAEYHIRPDGAGGYLIQNPYTAEQYRLLPDGAGGFILMGR